MGASTLARGFRERALREAQRYGSDPWVCVRELVQNARDAGATTVSLSVAERDGVTRLGCRDDGEGMTFEHARRYLFTLYASSKEGRRDRAGRFGVGFWAVLRFEPSRLVVRSWPRDAPAWEVELDGSLTHIVRRPAGGGHAGTEVVLERPARGGSVEAYVEEAARQNARFLTCRRDPARPLLVRVGGRPVNEPFSLPVPSAAFRRGRLRGVVGLGREARVELFAHGLRVRSAPSLEDLVGTAGKASEAARVRFPQVADGLAPQALIDGEVEVLLARGDARETPVLRRLVGLARRELARLVEHHIAAARPEPWWRRVPAPALVRAVGAAALLGGAFAAGTMWGGGWRSVPGPRSQGSGRTAAPRTVVSGLALPPERAYRDLGSSYPGPDVAAPEASLAPLALRYEPRSARPRLALLVLSEPGAGAGAPRIRGAYEAPPCSAGCLEIELPVDAEAGVLRLPCPSGHRVDPGSVLLGGRAARVLESSESEALLALPAPTAALLRYRTGPGAPERVTEPADPGLPEPLARHARALRVRPVAERVAGSVAIVRSAVRYSDTAEVAERHRLARARPFVLRALEVGAGDCDVQNGILALMLQASGVPARLAVGYLGDEGGVAPWLHAWVEYSEGSGPWRVADASAPRAVPPAARRAAATPRGEAASSAAPASAPSPAAASEPVARRSGSLAVLATLGALGAALALTVGLVRGRTRRDLRPDPSPDLVRLIRGVLGRPEAFADVPAAFHRRLVPLLGGGALSLAEAWQRAEGGRLFATHGGSLLARRTARCGIPVLDTRREEGRVVADGLGAVSLDAWDDLLRASSATPLLRDVAARLRAEGETWELRAARGAGDAALIDLPRRALGAGFLAPHVLVLDAADPDVVRADALARERPAEAAFVLTDRLSRRLGFSAATRTRLLAPLAQAALEEAAP